MADREDGFLSRWSRRKRDPDKDEDPSAEPDKVERAQAAVPVLQGDEEADEDAGDPEVVAKLPDIESLDETSDFAPFMAEGVPEILRRRALRKLWRLNPVFANLDGLNDYDEDFTDAANLLSEIKTVYKVGKGMVDREAAEAPAEAPAQETDQDTAEETAAVEGSGEPAPAQPQLAASRAEASAVAEANSEEATQEAESDDKDRSVPVAEPLLRPGEHGEAGEAVPRKPADPPRRSAAARRWGESSE